MKYKIYLRNFQVQHLSPYKYRDVIECLLNSYSIIDQFVSLFQKIYIEIILHVHILVYVI